MLTTDERLERIERLLGNEPDIESARLASLERQIAGLRTSIAVVREQSQPSLYHSIGVACGVTAYAVLCYLIIKGKISL